MAPTPPPTRTERPLWVSARVLALLTLPALLHGGLGAPARAADPAAPAAVAPAAALAAPLPLNRATAAELAALVGVGAETAEAIVALRQSRGRLNSVEELRVIPGMTDATLDTLRAGTAVDLVVVAAARKEYQSVDEVMAEFDHEPTVQQVQTMAMAYTHTNREQVERWITASRVAAWLPELQVRGEYYNRLGSDYDYLLDADGVPYAQLSEGDIQDQWRGTVEVRWRLDDLVMSSEQIRVISEAQDIVKLRDKVLSEVTRLYFDRRRLQVDLLLKGSKDLRSQIDDQLRLMEYTAQLDAYTGGAFSAAVAGGAAAQP